MESHNKKLAQTMDRNPIMNFHRILFVLVISLMFACPNQNRAQSLGILQETEAGTAAFLAVNFTPESSGVVALQFDLLLNPKKVNPADVRISRGRSLSADHGFEFRQVQAGVFRIVIFPPIRQSLPALSIGEIARIVIPDLEKQHLDENDVRFKDSSVVCSDAKAQAIKIRSALPLQTKKSRRIP